MSIISHLHSNTIGGFRKLTFWLTESSSYTYLLTLSNTRLVLLIMAEPFMEFPVSEEYFWASIFDEYFLMSIFRWVFSSKLFSDEFFPTSFSLFLSSYFQQVCSNMLFQWVFFWQIFPTSISQQVFWPVFSNKFFKRVFQHAFFTSFWLEDFITSSVKHLMTCYTTLSLVEITAFRQESWRGVFLNKFSTNESTRIYNRSHGLYILT